MIYLNLRIINKLTHLYKHSKSGNRNFVFNFILENERSKQIKTVIVFNLNIRNYLIANS